MFADNAPGTGVQHGHRIPNDESAGKHLSGGIMKQLHCRAFILFLFLILTHDGAARLSDTVTVTYPGKSWSLAIDLPGFRQSESDSPQGNPGRIYYFGANDATGIAVSVIMEQGRKNSTNLDCRGYYWSGLQNAPIKRSNFRTWEEGTMAYLEYLAELPGTSIRQKNLFAFVVKENIYIQIHLSKVNFQPPDNDRFQKIMRSVGITSSEEMAPVRDEDLATGSKYFLQRDYKNAIVFYEKAFRADSVAPRLDKASRRVLTDNLGMSYGITGNPLKARSFFESALRSDSTYPMYYYNIACAYGELNNRDQAMKYLQLAFRYKWDMIPGETIPDPSLDASFQKYMSDEVFLKCLESLK